MYSLFEKARELFTSAADQKTLDEQIEVVRDLLDVQEMLDRNDGGKVLKKWLKSDISIIINDLINTGVGDEKRHTLVADLKAHLGLLNKLSVQADLDAIEQWLKDKLEE